MPETRSVTVKSDRALEVAAKALANCATADRPLAVVDDPHDKAELRRHPSLAGRAGVRITSTNALREAAALGAPKATALLAELDDNVSPRRSAARVRLLAQIYQHLKKLEIRKPLAFSVMFRDVLDQLEAVDPDAIDRDAVFAQNSHDLVELQTLFDLWDELCAARHDGRRENLAALAGSLQGPVVYLHWGDPLPWAMKFLGEVAGRGQVATEIKATLDDKSQRLDDLWNGEAAGKDGLPSPGLYKADSIEEAAHAALAIIGQWQDLLLEQKGTIGLVGHDRLLVRRVHSLLLQEGLHVSDSSGWLARNLLVGRGLLAVASAPGSKEELARQTLQVLAHAGKDDWWQLPRALSGDRPGMDPGLAGLEDLVQRFSKHGGKSASAWFADLADASEHGLLAGFFDSDPAGERLRNLLRLLAEEFSDLADSEHLSLGEIRGLLLDALSETLLVSATATSNIKLIQPGTFSTQRHDALLLLGPDEDNLPHETAPGLLGKEALESLGLATPEEQAEHNQQATALLFAHHERLAAVWKGPADASPYLQLMNPRRYRSLERPWEADSDDSGAVAGHEATLRRLPERFSPGDCGTLMGCPYRYHSHKMLGLREDPKDPLDRADLYGSFVHEILTHFHLALMEDPGLDHKAELMRLTDLAAAGSLPALEDDHHGSAADFGAEVRLVNAWSWSHALEKYAAQMLRLKNTEFAGIEAAEQTIEGGFEVAGEKIVVRGKYDRMDRYKKGGDTVRAIVDVKTGSPGKYKDHLEFPQLLLYVAITGAKAGWDHCAYWSVHLKEGFSQLEVVGFADLDPSAADNILDDLSSIFKEAYVDKVPMPANGAAETCRHCPYHGLCRKDHWRPETHR